MERTIFRSMRLGLMLAALAACMAAISCSGDDKKEAVALADEDTFCAEFASATCDWARGCCELTELRQILGLNGADPYSIELVRRAQADGGACRDLVHSTCVSSQRDLLESIRTKRVALNRPLFGSCIAEYRRASTECDVGIGTGPTLREACKPSLIFTGAAQANDPCFHELDCAKGLFCWRAGESTGAGICRAVVAQAQACRESTRCDESSTCVPVETRTSKCAPIDRQQDGAFCTNDALCLPSSFCNTLEFQCMPKRPGAGECNRSLHCLSGRCNRDERKCEPQRGRDERCNSHGECQDGLWCNPNYSASFCSRPLETGKANDACDGAHPCGTGLVCAGGKCQAPLPEGELCALDVQCNDESYCNKTTQLCVGPRKLTGETCTNSRECATTHYCTQVGLTPTCQPRINLTEACIPSQDACVAGARCNPATSVCEPALAADAPCVRSSDCQSSLICESFSGRCDARSEAGAACDESAACPLTQQCSSSAAKRLCKAALVVGEAKSCAPPQVNCDTGLFCATDGTCHRLGQVGATCSNLSQCGEGLYCNSLTQKCATYGVVSSPCSTYELCGTGLYCAVGACRATAAIGQLCSTSSSGTDPLCSPGSQCQYATHPGDEVASYKCVTLPGESQACSPVPGCAAGLFCSTTSFTCAKLGQAGSGCTTTAQCVQGLTCDLEQLPSVCVAPKAAGAECTSATQCATGLTCHSYSGTCSDRTAAGASCLGGSQQCAVGYECLLDQTCKVDAQAEEKCDVDHPCAPGLRCDDEWGVCKPLVKPALKSGLRCHVDEDCASGSCVDHVCTGACQGVGH